MRAIVITTWCAEELVAQMSVTPYEASLAFSRVHMSLKLAPAADVVLTYTVLL
jgi:hypothetical protein